MIRLSSAHTYHRPIIFNGILWLVLSTAFLFIFSGGNKPIAVDYIFTTAFTLFMVIPISINFYVLIPKSLKKERYLRYSIYFISMWAFTAALWQLIMLPVLNWLFPSYFFINYILQNNFYAVFSIVLLITTLIKLAEDWLYFNRLQNNQLKLRNTHIETQLSALRAQINPHFLFNSLNVIYAMALANKKEITTAIVQLSDILRYVIYDTNTEQIPLKQEIALLKNYIAFQNHRSKDFELVDFVYEVENEDFKIYPMLLLPLLENSFKYGFADHSEQEKIQLEIQQKNDSFLFTIKNKNLAYKNDLDDNYSGIGLENLKNNLNLVYPGKHQFTVDASKDSFSVTLSITDEDQ
jgi:sensor histidine kinase YesM